MLGEAELKLMKPNAIVLNTARGKVVDETALARAIAEGRIRGAAIDAFEEEPLPMDSLLHKLGDRVLLSPHSASYTEGGELRQGVAWATRSVITALKGGIPDNVYNREVLPRWKERFGGRQRDLGLTPLDNRPILLESVPAPGRRNHLISVTHHGI